MRVTECASDALLVKNTKGGLTLKDTNEGVKLALEACLKCDENILETNHMCCQAVDLIYSAAGSSAIYSSNKIAYHFANAQVIRQHGFMNESRYETAAQVYLGLQPDLPVVAF